MNNEKPNIMDLLKNEKVEWKTLGEIGEIYSGITGKSKKDFNDGNEKFITYKNVFDNPELNLDITDRVLILPEEEQRTIEYGDIIFTGSSEIKEESGMSSVVTKKPMENLYLNSFCFFLRLNDTKTLLPDFSKHLFRSDFIREKISKMAFGVTRFNISKKKMKELKIPIPSIETQEKIVKILDKFTKCVTELQTELQKRTAQYEFYRDKLLKEEYLKELSKKIDHLDSQRELRVTTLGEIGEFINGSGMPKILFNENGSVGAIHYGHIYTQYDIFVKNPIVKIYEEDAKTLKKVNFGDLVIARTSENIDDVMKTVVYLGEKEAVAGGHTVILKHNENGKYLSYLFNGSHDFIKQKNRLANGVKVIEVSIEDMKKIKITLPSIEIQNIVVQILDQFQKLVMDTKGLLPKEIEERQKQYEYYREKLLTFTPECGTTDRPTDRPTLSDTYLTLLRHAAKVAGVVIEGVEWKILGEVCEFHRGTSITQKNVKKGEVPVIGGGQIPAYYHNKSNREGVTITIAGSGAYAGYVSYWTVPIFLSDAFSIEPDININKRYLYHWFLNNQYKIYELKKGSGIAHVYGKDLGKFQIPIPSLAVQKYVVSVLDRFDSLVNDISQGLPKEIAERQKQYEYYRERLLDFRS